MQEGSIVRIIDALDSMEETQMIGSLIGNVGAEGLQVHSVNNGSGFCAVQNILARDVRFFYWSRQDDDPPMLPFNQTDFGFSGHKEPIGTYFVLEQGRIMYVP